MGRYVVKFDDRQFDFLVDFLHDTLDEIDKQLEQYSPDIYSHDIYVLERKKKGLLNVAKALENATFSQLSISNSR